MHRAHDLCVRRRVALATPRGRAVWDASAYPTGPADRYQRPRAPLVSALVLRAHDFIAFDFIMMFLVACALQDEPAKETDDHRLGRGAKNSCDGVEPTEVP